MKLIIAVVGVVLAAGGTLAVRNWTRTASSAAPRADALYTVKRGTLTVTLTENGTLVAKKSEKINYEGRRGGGKITYLIEEGKSVQTDEVLCRLDTQELEQSAQQMDLDIKKAEVDLKSAQTEFEIQKGENVANIEKARIAKDKAEKELEKYRDGEAPKERRALEIKITEAETTHSRAKKKYEDSVKLLAEDFISKAQVELDEIEFKRAEISLDAAKSDLELFEKYTFPMTMTDRRTALSDAERGLQNAELRATSTLEQKEVTVRGNEQRLGALRKNHDEVVKEIEKCTIKAPSPGIVLHGDPQQRWMNERLKLGANIWGGQTLFTIPDLRVMQVQIQVHEADINKLKSDQPASVTMDTYPGLVLKGKVTKIAQVAAGQNDWGSDDDVKKFPVEITMEEDAALALRPGISAKAEVFIEARPNVVFVPRQSVFLEEGRHFAFVMRGETPAKTEVKIDVSSDTYTQVTEGLSEGDRVLLYNPQLGASSASKESKTSSQPAAPAAAAPTAAAPKGGP
ncbi:MAG: efflux RND transporter periplasmic adaptor subunit [Planctomycetes bacterium]|nr:efflux RND transporter periplasmic adaptor subunit [Planctomycetota bacterium]